MVAKENLEAVEIVSIPLSQQMTFEERMFLEAEPGRLDRVQKRLEDWQKNERSTLGMLLGLGYVLIGVPVIHTASGYNFKVFTLYRDPSKYLDPVIDDSPAPDVGF